MRRERDARNVNEHRLVMLLAGLLVHEARTLPLDLHTRARLLLDVLDKHTLRWQLSERTLARARQMAYELTEGPTTFARTLKFLIVSIPTGIFSSGHLRCSPVSANAERRLPRIRTRSLMRELLSSTNEPMSILIKSLTLSMAFCSISLDVAEMWRYRGGSLSVALVLSGYHVPLVLTEAPVSS